MAFITARKLIAKAGKGAATKQLAVYENVARWIARGIQLIFALVVAGLYGHRVDENRRHGDPQSVAWVYATGVAGLTCVTCLVYAIPFAPVHRLWAADASLAVLWLVAFAIFAGIFLHRESGTEYEGTSVRVMKVAVWLDLVNCLLWVATSGYGAFRTFLGRKAQALENRIDNKLGAYEAKAMGKVTEKLPPGMVEVVDKMPPGVVKITERFPMGRMTERLPPGMAPAHLV